MLTARHRKEVSEYYSVDWANSRLLWGQTILTRKPVNRSSSTSIPRSELVPAIFSTVIPEYTIPYGVVGQSSLEVVRNLAETGLPAKISFLQQCQVMISTLGQKRKFIPGTPGAENIAYMRHALGGSLYRIDCNLTILTDANEQLKLDALKLIGEAIMRQCRLGT